MKMVILALILVVCTSLVTHTVSIVVRAGTPLPPETAAALKKVAQDVASLKVPAKAESNSTSANPLKVTTMSQCSFLAGHVTGAMTQRCCSNVQIVMQRQLHNYGLASKCKSTWACEADGVTPQKAFEVQSLSALCGEPGCLPRVVKAMKGNPLTAHSASSASHICSRLAELGGASANADEVSAILSTAQNKHRSQCKTDDGSDGHVNCLEGKKCDKKKMMKDDGKDVEQCQFCSRKKCNKDDACECEKDMACFPGEAVVDVKGAGKTLLHNVRKGDQILVDQQGTLAYEPVLSFLHSIPAGLHRFKSIIHEGGALRASANHIVIVATDSKGSSWKSKLVDDVQVGDYLFSTQNGTMGRTPSRVKATHYSSTRSGMFAPLTYSGTIVVDGVVASNYASRSSMQHLPHSLAHAFLFPVRLYHRLVLNFFPGQSSKRIEEVTSAELHPYLQIAQHLSVLLPSK